MQVEDIEVSKIFSNPEFNCRGRISPVDVLDLAKDIEANGLLSPIVVRPVEHEHFTHEIIAGHRRHKAFEVLQQTDKETWLKIPCTVRTDLSESDAILTNLNENLIRKELNVVQEAKALQKLKLLGWTLGDTANRIGKSTTWVRIRFIVLDFPHEIQEACAQGLIKQPQILELSKIADKDKQMEFALQCKLAAERGDRVRPRPPKKAKEIFTRKVRNKHDIQHMVDHISEAIGFNFGTRTLAWANGEISDLELYRDIKDIADKAGLNYDIPIELDLGVVG